MKFPLLLILLVALTVNIEAKRRINWRKVWKVVKIVARAIVDLGRKRDISTIDRNNDGFVDLSEVEEAFGTREARDILEMADEDGNSDVTVGEFQKFMTDLSKVE
ncbi:uncharacterized protein LOC121377613 [Gigantopelta aegis]|uniref:uncharacterized protein LOC121377613 n=1 Tax=Gigantopelta aegis TaxID=1735272 RepID=UPI001B88C270|nr:uncharacterized protein LOC121377613 [Gigantopelta aegis]